MFQHFLSGHVGVPGPEWEIKLADVHEMGYFVRDNKGEVCVKGPGVFKVTVILSLCLLGIYCIYLVFLLFCATLIS